MLVVLAAILRTKLLSIFATASSSVPLKEVLAANKHNKVIGTNYNKRLPVGTKVYIPYNVEHHTSLG